MQFKVKANMFKRTFFLKTGDTAAALFQHRELLCAFCRACKSGAIRFDEIMFPYVALTKDKAWQPGPYEGVELMILHKHESTGGVVVLRKFKAGHTIPAHTHPDTNE